MITNTQNKKASWITSVWLLMFYAIWRFLFTNTTFGIRWVVYVFIILLFGLLAYNIVALGRCKIYLYSCVCIPFIFYFVIRYCLSGDFEAASYWLDCFMLILMASNVSFNEGIPRRLFIISGVIVMAGILVQMVMPDLYYANIASNFSSYSQIKYWGSIAWYAGFTYQVGHSAEVLLVAEGAFLYLSEKFKFRKIIRIIITIAFVFCIFLTGKRSLSVLSILVPLLVYLFSASNTSKRQKRMLIVSIVVLCLFLIFIQNMDRLSNSSSFGIFAKFSNILNNFRSGEVIDSGRDHLRDMAIQCFKTNPVFGIGAGKFTQMTGSNTNAHNVYVQILCELGLVGFILFLLMILFYLTRTIRLLKVAEEKKYIMFSLFLQLEFLLNSLTENLNILSYFTYFMAVGIFIYSYTISLHAMTYRG